MEGFFYKENFLEKEDEKKLLELINGQNWDGTLKRRTQHYNFRYLYVNAKFQDENYLVEPITDWLYDLYSKCVVELNSQNAGLEMLEKSKLQVLINEYEKNQGISAHIDDKKIFGDFIITVSLSSHCVMEFSLSNKKSNDKKICQLIHPRSLYMLSGPARNDYFHSIPAKENDYELNGILIKPVKRISITFRQKI